MYRSSQIGDTKEYQQATFGFFESKYEGGHGVGTYPDGGLSLYTFYSNTLRHRRKPGAVETRINRA